MNGYRSQADQLTGVEESSVKTYLESVASRASEYIRQSKAKNTVKAYQNDWTDFQNWCGRNGKDPLPASAETVALYLTALSEAFKPSTLTRRMASISNAHRAAAYESPTRDANVRLVLAGVRRVHGTRQNSKAPLLVEDLKEMVARSPEGILGTRNRALLLLGFAGGFRRSELVGVNVDDVNLAREGLVVTIRHSKSDQERRGRQLGIPYGANAETCPVRAYLKWLQVSATTKGPIFRPITRHGRILEQRLSTNAVAEIVKKHAKALGLDADRFAGHSLRSGLATSAARAGASERSIQNQTGHRSVVMLRRYIRSGSLFRDNVLTGLGL